MKSCFLLLLSAHPQVYNLQGAQKRFESLTYNLYYSSAYNLQKKIHIRCPQPQVI